MAIKAAPSRFIATVVATITLFAVSVSAAAV
jgi:hypothetical protein